MVLFRRDSRRGQVISAASPLALQDGACVGMPISEAKSLLRRGGHFHIFEHDLDADLAGIETLADSLDCFSPLVGLETVEPSEHKRGRRPDSILLDVTGLAHLFGDESQLARQLLVHCDQLGYLPRVAVASTVGEAWAMARFVAGRYFAQYQQPVVLSVADQEAIPSLPVEACRLPIDMVETLYQLGIKTIGQLQRLSRNDLAMRFGDTLHRRMDQLTGKIEEPVVARRKPVEFVAEQLLEYSTNHGETIRVIIARLVAKLCDQMRSRQQGALQWSIELVCQSGLPVRFDVNLFQPTATTDHVLPLVEMQLEQVLSPQTHRGTTIEVNAIIVSVTSNVLLAQQQRQLFDENPRLDRQSLAQLINRLASRVGSHRVVYPVLQSGAQPEYSFRLKPLVDARRRRRQRASPPKQSHVLARPFRLFCPPIRLNHLSVSSDDHPSDCEIATPPALLSIDSGDPQKIISSCGPERIETGWWRGITVCRDYWRVETETCQQFWVYRNLRTGVWFLHGEF